MATRRLPRNKTPLDGLRETPSVTSSSRDRTPDVVDDATRPVSRRNGRRGSQVSTASSTGRRSRAGSVASSVSKKSSRAGTPGSAITGDSEDDDDEEEDDEDDDGEEDEDEDSEEDVVYVKENGMSHQTTSSSSSHFEFLGPHGTILVVLAVPFTAFTLQLLNDPVKGFPPPSFYTSPFATLKDRFAESTIFNITSFLIVWAWLAFQAALHGFLPGTYAKGNPVPATGQRLEYKINAFSCLVATYLALYVLFSARGVEPFLWVADNMLPLATATSTIALTASVLLYVLSHRIPEDPVHNPVITAAGGDTGYPLYDFWMGRELNPRLFGWFDLKYFCELRPGIIGWTVLNLCLAIKQHHIFGSVSDGMLLVVLFQGYYAIDALWNERAILTTMDITTDGFGMMLCFGDLVWVPFTYSLQALYLATNPASLSRTSILAIVLLELFGMYIFRAANSEKNAFRTDPTHPSVQHLEYINTQRGTRLLVSGWWGLARHINYFGDWLMGLAWCLTTGFASPIPYFYALYFAILLVHRDRRDEAVCRAKYGADWDVYTATVPYRFIPGLW